VVVGFYYYHSLNRSMLWRRMFKRVARYFTRLVQELGRHLRRCCSWDRSYQAPWLVLLHHPCPNHRGRLDIQTTSKQHPNNIIVSCCLTETAKQNQSSTPHTLLSETTVASAGVAIKTFRLNFLGHSANQTKQNKTRQEDGMGWDGMRWRWDEVAMG
jgi:hypothetical protein